jgi:formyltetrahydrofolate-dependent phosphoribosylglycinamide formyltransferase
MSRTRAAVLISGRGSNMEALCRAARDPDFPVEIALVLANRPDAAGLVSASEMGVETLVVDHRPFEPDREGHERAVDAALREREVTLVALAGWMRVLTPWFVRAWAGRLVNIHPSLLPAFPGLRTHRRALEAGVRIHGCTVHLVDEGVDEGPILGQAAVPVLAGDDERTLAARVLSAEHRLYPVCLAAMVQRKTAPGDPDAVLISV